MTRYRLDPVFDRTPDGAVKGIIRYDIYLDGHFVGSRRTHALCHHFLDELMPSISKPGRASATIHELHRHMLVDDSTSHLKRRSLPIVLRGRLTHRQSAKRLGG